jgi:O-antigen/teichoic acid export membrane protein
MSETHRRVVKNSGIRVGGYVIGAALQFAVVVIIARYLGTEKFGYFSFIFAVAGLFQLLADMGVRNILIRNIAVDKANFRYHLGIARTLLWILSLISMGCIVVLANLLPLTTEVRHSLYLAGLAVMVIFHGLGYSAVFRAFEEMEWDILGLLLQKGIFIALIWGVSRTDFGLPGVCMAQFLANTSQWLYCWGLVGIRYGRASLSRDFTAAWALLTEAFPLGIAEILRRTIQHVGKLLLTALGTPVAVGLFSAAYKFLEAMTPFTASLTLPLFPVFSRLAQTSHQKLCQAYAQSLKFLYVIGMPLVVMLFVLSDRLMLVVFGTGYQEAAVTLRLLVVAMFFLFPTAIHGYLFTALGRQRLYTVCMAAALGVNTLVALVLIPSYSHTGAAVGTLAAEAILFLMSMLMLRQLGSALVGLHLLWRPLVAGLAMGSICWFVKDLALLSVMSGMGSSLAVYAGLLLFLQTFTQQEMALVRDAVRLGSVTR